MFGWLVCLACGDLFIRWLDKHPLRSDFGHSQSWWHLLGGLMVHILGWAERFNSIICQYCMFNNTLLLKCQLWHFPEHYLSRCDLKIVHKVWHKECQTESIEGSRARFKYNLLPGHDIHYQSFMPITCKGFTSSNDFERWEKWGEPQYFTGWTACLSACAVVQQKLSTLTFACR